MTQSYNLTANELRAALVLVQSCLRGMGGKRPSDLEDDEYTWVAADDLVVAGWSKFEAAGTWGALELKGIISEYDRPSRQHPSGTWVLQTAAWRWLDTIWDARAA